MSQASPSLPADDEIYEGPKRLLKGQEPAFTADYKAAVARRLTGGGATVDPSSDASSSRTRSDT